MKKNILIILGIVVLVLAILVWRVAANLDGIVADTIENVGSDVLKTKVSVSGVSIDLKAGKAVIAGLTVANPEGWSRANLFELAGIGVDLDLASMSQDVLVIESIKVENPKVVLEGNANGGSNMQTLLNNIDSGPSDSASGAPGEQTKMVIESFVFSGGHVKASTALKPGEVMEIDLPTVKITGIGSTQGGVTADVVAKEITGKLVTAVIKSAAKEGLNKVIEKKAKGLWDKIKGKN